MRPVYQLVAQCSESLEGFGNQKISSRQVFGSMELADAAKPEFMEKVCNPDLIPCFIEENTTIYIVELELWDD